VTESNPVSRCWCGNTDLEKFSGAYVLCAGCCTLVRREALEEDLAHVRDEGELYSSDYYVKHLPGEYGYPDLLERARGDLTERILHWLRALLKYKVPPARVLELGSAHGGFVAMLRWAGFDATGLELSPWVADFARQTFNVPMLVGPVEDQVVERGSLDVIALMDVLEHLPDPVGTIRHCLTLLRPDGFLLVQTPRMPEGKTYERLQAEGDRFLEQLKEKEHLYLFSERSIGIFFHELGTEYVVFEPAIFAHYDMFLVASAVPLPQYSSSQAERVLMATPGGRMVQALLDREQQIGDVNRRHAESEADLRRQLEASEADRAARLTVIEELGRRLGELEAERDGLRAELADLRQQFEAAEADRAARLTVIEAQGQEVTRLQAEVDRWLQTTHKLQERLERAEAARLTVIEELGRQLIEREAERDGLRAELTDVRQRHEAVELDRAARLAQTEAERDALRAESADLRRQFEAAEVDRAARLEVIETQGDQIGQLQAQLWAARHVLQCIRSGRAYRFMRGLGRWGWVEQALSQPSAETPSTFQDDGQAPAAPQPIADGRGTSPAAGGPAAPSTAATPGNGVVGAERSQAKSR
jgi:2-polyprenyl-3-methyl-5-hydroxy-6-metoxy-1,4-benzoquinol methylase